MDTEPAPELAHSNLDPHCAEWVGYLMDAHARCLVCNPAAHHRVHFEQVRYISGGIARAVRWTCTCGESKTIVGETLTRTNQQRANASATRHLKSHR